MLIESAAAGVENWSAVNNEAISGSRRKWYSN